METLEAFGVWQQRRERGVVGGQSSNPSGRRSDLTFACGHEETHTPVPISKRTKHLNRLSREYYWPSCREAAHTTPVPSHYAARRSHACYYGKATETYCDVPGVTTVRRTAVGLIVVCVVLLWAVFPIFIGSPDYVLALTVNSSMSSDCPAESACFTLELRNRAPWPITIDIVELQFYPSLIGPSVNVNWLGPGPEKLLVLMPFTGQTYTFWIKIMGGLRPPDTVYVILTANVTVLYVSHYVVLHSGKR